jgi:hypothetical protein
MKGVKWGRKEKVLNTNCMSKKIRKIVFVDTNIFVSCIFEEMEGLNLGFLDKIKKLLNKNKIILVLPEVIKNEIENELKMGFYNLENGIESKLSERISEKEKDKKKKSLLPEIYRKLEKDGVKLLKIKQKKSETIINSIFEHKNTRIIKLNNDIITLGITRSLRMIPPYNDYNKDKPTFLKDRDCIAFESLLYSSKEIKDSNNLELIICTDDCDYYRRDDKNKLDSEIEKDASRKFKTIFVYKNLIQMLRKKFNEHYTVKQEEKYQDREILVSPLVHTGVAEPLRTLAFGTDPFSMLSRKFLPRNSKFCCVCGNNIENSLRNFEVGTIPYPFLSVNTLFTGGNDFTCPYCGTRFQLT